MSRQVTATAGVAPAHDTIGLLHLAAFYFIPGGQPTGHLRVTIRGFYL